MTRNGTPFHGVSGDGRTARSAPSSQPASESAAEKTRTNSAPAISDNAFAAATRRARSNGIPFPVRCQNSAKAWAESWQKRLLGGGLWRARMVVALKARLVASRRRRDLGGVDQGARKVFSACGNSTGALSRVRVTDQNVEGSAVMTDDFARSISMRRCRWAGRSATRSGLQFRLVSGGFFISTIAEFGASFPENKLHSPRTPFRRSCRTLRSFRATANAQRLGNFSTSETKICLRRSQPRHSCMLKKSAPHTLV